MKAVRYHEVGPPEVLRIDDVPTPEPGEGQVLIKLDAAGVNFADVGRRSGRYPETPPLPAIPGLEGAGTVAALGPGVTSVREGERVLAFGLPYSYSEYAIARPESVFPVPPNITTEEAAAIGTTFFTAWNAVTIGAAGRAGETVVIHAAGSGCGVAATQIAKHVGMRVIATASTDEKLQKAKALGADDLVNYASHDFVAEVMRLTDGQGADAVLDGVGGDTLLRSLECLRTGGKLVTYGASSGERSPQIDVFRLWLRNLSLVGVSTRMNGYAAFPTVLEMIAAGKLKPVIDRVFPLAEAAAAHRHLEERRVFGKVVLSIN